MPAHPDLPKPVAPLLWRKSEIFSRLKRIDMDGSARQRILEMESAFRAKITAHISGLPQAHSKFRSFSTNPFVLMFYAMQNQYKQVEEVAQHLVRAKAFSSMETSAGKMIETVTLPVYGWECIESAMHSHESLLDGRKVVQSQGEFVAATLKSGPRTLNDGMAKDIGHEVVARAPSWALRRRVQEVDFTYGVLYGTRRLSNKKDWHILRNIDENRLTRSTLVSSHRKSWSIRYQDGPLTVSATIRIGIDWWDFLGGPDTWLEVCCALIRACIIPSVATTSSARSTIADLPTILDVSCLPAGYNVSILQRSQLEWLLFLARHFVDDFEEE